MTLIKLEVNCETGEETIAPLSAEEIAQRKADMEALAAEKAAYVEPTVAEKLASVGLDLNDLKAALGL